MWKRMILVIALCSLSALLIWGVNPGTALPPVESKVVKETAPAPAKTANNRVVGVTVYPNSALITREVEVTAGQGAVEVTVTPLPSTTVQSSLYAEGTETIRVLSTRFRTRPIFEDTREDVRKLQDELKTLQQAQEKIDAEMKGIDAVQTHLGKLETFTSSSTAHLADKGMLNSDSTIALSKYILEARSTQIREQVKFKHELQTIQEKAEFARRKLNDLTAAPSRTENDAIIVLDKTNAAAGKVRLNYLVDGASWRPQYKLRAGKESKEAIKLEYLAALSQQTGEDWSSVKLTLSTAQPTLNAAPPDLHSLNVTATPRAATPTTAHPGVMELEQQVKSLRSMGQKDFNEKKQSAGVEAFNKAAALDQSWELLNPEAAVKRGCALAVMEGPSVTYHLATPLTIPSRNDEQVIEVTRFEVTPEYYYKAVPVLTHHVYRLADVTNKSKHVLLPGEATMYIGTDFVGQQNIPLVAIGEQFTAGFGVDPQLQVTRQMMDRSRTMSGGNQSLRYDYRILVSSYKAERAKVQVWDRLPNADTEAVGVSLIKTAPEVSTDALYLREQRPTNLLRWDVQIDSTQNGEKALAINYQFKLDLDRNMTISSFQSATAALPAPAPTPTPNMARAPAMPPMASGEDAKIKAQMAKLSVEDRKLAETQIFCAIDQDSRLGSTGPIFKEIVKGRPIFICCRGCVSEVKSDPEAALKMLDKLMVKVNAMRR